MDENHRFRRALKNPILVIVLCLLAGLAVYANMMPSDFAGIISSRGSSGGLDAWSSAPASLSGSRVDRTIKKEAIGWVDHPDRDPFSPITSAIHAPSISSSRGSPDKTEERPQHGLTLKAVAVEGRHRSAVINRTVVYEGEVIEGFQVMLIQPKGVWLKHQGKTEWLTFSGKRAS
jgi:hypothetical protein